METPATSLTEDHAAGAARSRTSIDAAIFEMSGLPFWAASIEVAGVSRYASVNGRAIFQLRFVDEPSGVTIGR